MTTLSETAPVTGDAVAGELLLVLRKLADATGGVTEEQLAVVSKLQQLWLRHPHSA